jgi:outer membrane protein assembly factor BamB
MAAAADTLCVAGDPVRGLSASNGKESWSLSGRQGDYLTATAVSEEVFIVTSLSAAVALDPHTGQQKWHTTAELSRTRIKTAGLRAAVPGRTIAGRAAGPGAVHRADSIAETALASTPTNGGRLIPCSLRIRLPPQR